MRGVQCDENTEKLLMRGNFRRDSQYGDESLEADTIFSLHCLQVSSAWQLCDSSMDECCDSEVFQYMLREAREQCEIPSDLSSLCDSALRYFMSVALLRHHFTLFERSRLPHCAHQNLSFVHGKNPPISRVLKTQSVLQKK